MKKLLFLFAVLLSTVSGWAQSFTLQKSTDEGNPQFQYVIQNANSVFMGPQTSPADTERGKFAFFAADGATENDVLVYSINANMWVSYEKSNSYSNTKNFAKLVENKEDANPWHFTTNTNGNEAVYQFAPYNNSGVATKYWNWFQGTTNNSSVGLYSSAANSDNGSAWILWQVNGKRKYYLQDVHNTYLNLSVLGQEPSQETTQNRLATLTLEQAALYVTVASDGRLQIHTEENGGNYLKQSVVDAKYWNSWVSEGAEDFFWTQEFSTQNGQRCLVLRNTSGNANGLLGCTNHTAGEPLYVNASNANALKLKMIDGNAEFAHITYKFVYKGQERATEEYYMPVGSTFPSVQTVFPDYIHCNPVPAGNVDIACNGKTYVLNLYDEMPFQVSDSYENAVWYYMNIRSSGNNDNKPNKWVKMSDGETYTSTYGEKPTTDDAQWAFIGNPYDGIKVINKDAGANKTLSLNVDNIVMKEEQKVWNLQKGTGGFVLQAEKNTNIYAHDHKGSFKTWDSSNAKTDAGSAFNVIDVRSDAFEYATNVILGSKITGLATIQDGQTVVFKSVPNSKYINISTALETGISATLSGLSVFKIHVVDASTFTFESCREGYYFPDITDDGAQNVYMTETPNQYTILSKKSDNGALSEGQFVIKSLGANGGYFDVLNGNDFCGWEGKGDNCVYEIYSVTALGTTSAGTVNHCVLTDDNNNIYQYDYWALPGTNPTISGIPSSCITNGRWNDKTYTAHVSFPFPASSTNQINPTMISSFKSGYVAGYENTYKWYAKNDNKVWVSRGVLPDVANLDAYSWAIYPEFANGTFSFAIMNLATEKYVSTTADYAQNYGESGVVTLEDTNTPKYYTLGDYGYLSYIGTTNKISQYLSAGGSGNTDQELGVWAKTHKGAENSFLPISYTKTISSEGVTTLFTPYAVEIPDGVTVKYVEASKNQETTGNIEYTELTGSIPANTAVLLEGFAGTYTFNSTEEAVDELEDNILFGYSENTNVSASTHTDNVYNIATDKKGRIAFYEYEGTKYQAYAAYLDVTSLNVQGTPEYFNVVDMSNYFVLQTSVEGWTENNPNTHLGTISLTNGENTVVRKMEASALDNYYYKLDKSLNTTLALTRKYRGYEFLGFWLGETELGLTPTLTEEQVNDVNEANPIIAKYKPTDEVTLFYDDDEFSYRIPAIAKTSTGRLIAVSDYRHCLDDIGMNRWGKGYRIDLVIRTSDDNGKTWSAIKTIAEGIDDSQADDCAYGDAAIAVVGNEVIVMAVAGATQYGTGNEDKVSRLVRIYSSDNGETWEKTDITANVYGHEGSLYPEVYTAFFGSGKLAVDPDFNRTGNARIYGAMLTQGKRNQVIYSDDKGLTWQKLGTAEQVADANEPKVEILPSGQILFSARRSGGRTFNVFTYTDKATNAGSWESAQNGCSNGGDNATNGEIMCVDAKKPDGTQATLLLQSQPKGGSGDWDRQNVTIWYKEITDQAYTTTQIKDGWTEGLQVSHQLSAYSAMAEQADGKIAFFFEEAPCYQDRNDWGYSMVYVPLTIENITAGNYFQKDADFDARRNFNVVLTDAQGNEYVETIVDKTLAEIASSIEDKYPFITLGDKANFTAVDENTYNYTNTVTLPFKVSNEDGTYWHNMYWPTATGNAPVYMGADTSGETYVITFAYSNQEYGDSPLNTQANERKISWAIYSVDNGFTFKFKNKLTDKYIKVSGVANGDAKNAVYADEASATAFELVPDVASYNGDYALKAAVEETIGYLCATSWSNGYATHYQGNGHQGAWVIFKEAPDFDALITEVNDVLSWIGEGLGKYAVSGSKTETAGTAKTAMQTPNTVKLNDLNTYKNLLDGATLNKPETGQFFRIRGISGNYIDASSIYNNPSATEGQMSMKSAEECNYAGTIFYLDANNNLLNYATGRYVKETREIGSVGDSRGVWTFAESPRGNAKYALSCTTTNSHGPNLHDNEGNRADRCSDNCGDRHDFTLEPVTELPLTIHSSGKSTYSAPVDLKIPEGVTVYYAKDKIGDRHIRMYPLTGMIPANTGVVVAGAGETTVNFPITTGVTELENNLLKPVVAAKAVTPESGNSVFVMATKNDVTGFYPLSTTNNVIGGHKSYLEIPANPAARLSIVWDDTETGIFETEGGVRNAEIYDLTGRRLVKPAKGVNVIGGKLVIK